MTGRSQPAQMAAYLHRARHAELEPAAPGAPIDLTAAFGDLIDFKPRWASCVAWPETASAGTALW